MTDPKLTPREPTPEMLKAGRFAAALEVIAEPYAIWRAMHDAAPTVEAEPVAWTWNAADGFKTHHAAPQPAALPELSDAEIAEAIDNIDFSRMVTASDMFYLIARAVIAALKGKQ